MLVSSDKKFIFIHVPKTGGTSLGEALSPYCCSLRAVARPNVRLNRDKHIDARELCAIIKPQIWSDYYKFTIVRNPWELMLSHYMFFRTKSKSKLGQLARKLSLSQYITWYFTENTTGKFNYGFDLFCTNSDKTLALNAVYRLEDIDTWYSGLCTALSIPEVPLKTKNTTRHKHYREYYNSESRRLVEKAFLPWLSRFSYTF